MTDKTFRQAFFECRQAYLVLVRIIMNDLEPVLIPIIEWLTRVIKRLSGQ